jgi:hypothetical protein
VKIDVYFLPGNAQNIDDRQEAVSAFSPIIAEAYYFALCKNKKNIEGRVIVKSRNLVTLDAEYLTGNCRYLRCEQNEERYRMIWASSSDWLKPCPLQMRGLAMACCGKQRGYQTRFAKLLDIDPRTWRNWAKLVNNKKQIPWYAWYAALSIFMN